MSAWAHVAVFVIAFGIGYGVWVLWRKWWDRLCCVFGRHAYGYWPESDSCLCFACGRLAPLRMWRELRPR